MWRFALPDRSVAELKVCRDLHQGISTESGFGLGPDRGHPIGSDVGIVRSRRNLAV